MQYHYPGKCPYCFYLFDPAWLHTREELDIRVICPRCHGHQIHREPNWHDIRHIKQRREWEIIHELGS